ncbi:MAG: ComEC/Rec2 family competence protein [Pseudomonadota bacterium]
MVASPQPPDWSDPKPASAEAALSPSSSPSSSPTLLQALAPLAQSVAHRGRASLRWLSESLAAENVNAGLWLPVALGIGVVAYFSLPFEPDWRALCLLGLVALPLAVIVRTKWPIAGWAIFWALLGFGLADVRVALVDAPVLEKDLSIRSITGRVVAVEEGNGRQRFVVAPAGIDRLQDEKVPAKIRVNWRGTPSDAAPGDLVSFRAGLSPPPPPVAPGAYDYARQLYFERIGAVGFAVSAPLLLETSADNSGVNQYFAARAEVEKVRVSLFSRIVSAAPGEGGAIIAAIVTGKRAAISEEAQIALRDSGLAHLIAISGLHMGLASGLLFFCMRFLLALSPQLALNYPIKKWAALAAMAAGLAYLLLSGGGWSARRAFIMTSIVFVAILVDRRALSLRNVAIAATILIVLTPEAILHPGFQMSFAAVTALIAGYEWMSARDQGDLSFTVLARLRRYLVGIGITDLIAAVATAPFSLFHFQRAAVYSLPANLVAMPIMAFWIVPSCLAAIFLMPLGVDAPFWRLAAGGMELILSVCRSITSVEGAVVTVPRWSPVALGVITLGGLWFCLMAGRVRWLAFIAMPVFVLTSLGRPTPIVFVDGTWDNVGVVDTERAATEYDGPVLGLLAPRRDKFAAERWKEYVGFNALRVSSVPLERLGQCGPAGCVVARGGKTISIVTDRLALAEDCQRADLVIAMYSVSRRAEAVCEATLLSFWSGWNNGAHIISERNGKLIITSVRDRAGERPWSQYRSRYRSR